MDATAAQAFARAAQPSARDALYSMTMGAKVTVIHASRTAFLRMTFAALTTDSPTECALKVERILRH